MGITIDSTVSHPKGTIVVLEVPKKTKCTYVRAKKKRTIKVDHVYKAFFDKNNNGKLDKKDIMYDSSLLCKSCPKGSRTVHAAEGATFCVRSVTAKDIKKFGKVVSAEFNAAKKRRVLITPKVKRLAAKKKMCIQTSIYARKRRLCIQRGETLMPLPFMTLVAFGLKGNPKITDAVIKPEFLYSPKILYGFIDIR